MAPAKMRLCSLFSGSSGNCTYVSSGSTHLLVDAGASCRTTVAALASIGVDPAQLTGILVTHEHSDHIAGIGAIARKYNLPVYANAGTWRQLDKKLGDIALRNRRMFKTDEDFHIRQIAVSPFAISHDAAEPVGYSLYAQGRKITIMTDLGFLPHKLIDAAAGSDILLLESNHDVDMLRSGRYPQVLKTRILGRKGHLSNAACGEALCLLAKEGVSHVLLGHLSADNNLPDLAQGTVASLLLDAGITPGRDLELMLTNRDRPTPMLALP